MNIEMINKVPTYNANIGSEFDDASVMLKKKNTDYTFRYISFLALGAVFADTTGLIDPRISITLAVIFTILSIRFYSMLKKRGYAEQWTLTRIAAESFKSEWFKFAVGGGDYPLKDNVKIEDSINEFKKNLQRFHDEYIQSMHGNFKSYLNQVAIEVDEGTLDIRKRDLGARIDFYKNERMKNQMTWYQSKSREMKNKYEKHVRFFRGALFFGFLFGATMMLNSWEIISIGFLSENDFFSIAIAIGFALDGINSANQYERLASAYEKSFRELKDAIRELEDDKNDIKTDEAVFWDFVEDVENNISSEHKSWSLTTSSKNIH